MHRSPTAELLRFSPEVRAALDAGAPVVALETTVVSHGLPWPRNLEVANAMAAAVREAGATPAFVGLAGGHARIGLDDATLERFARERATAKASRRDLAPLLAAGRDGATTVAGTMALAALAEIRVFATGGIGGVHRGAAESLDVSADLVELGRSPVAVVCSGAKSILDLAKTLEVLETHGVPVVGYGTDRLPAFYLRDSPHPLHARADTPEAAARIVAANLALGAGGLVIANPIPADAALDPDAYAGWLEGAEADAATGGVAGKDLTPFLLERLAAHSDGRTLEANRALLVANAGLAARIARALAERAAH